MASRIEDYGLIGNTRTAALVSRTGSVDWFCAPRFDSDACLAALIGYDEHGSWALRPTVGVQKIEQRYRGETLILETDFFCDGGVVRVTDFMPIGEDSDRCDIVRLVEGLEGEVPVEMLLEARFGYGADLPWITPAGDDLHFVAGPDALALRAPVPTRITGNRVSAVLHMRKGDRVPLQLSWYPSHEDAPPALEVDAVLATTDSFWRAWAGRCTYEGRWRDLVVRSLITLKALTYLSEEYDSTLRRQIGNFPQAFSHLALISTAHVIESVRQGGEMQAPLRGGAAEGCTRRVVAPSGVSGQIGSRV